MYRRVAALTQCDQVVLIAADIAARIHELLDSRLPFAYGAEKQAFREPRSTMCARLARLAVETSLILTPSTKPSKLPGVQVAARFYSPPDRICAICD